MSSAGGEFCAYCGLPLSTGLGREGAAGEPDYCCSGCRVAQAVVAASAGDDAARRMLVRIGLGIFFTMNVLVFTMELWSHEVYADESYHTPFAQHLRGLFQWASLLFAAPVLLLLGGPLAAGVRQNLRRGAVSTDLLILLGVAASYLYSSISVLRGEGHIYFEVGCVVLVFVSLGRWLEARGKLRTSAALDELQRLLPEFVCRAKPASRDAAAEPAVERVLRTEVVIGDVVRVLPGERIPVDGRIARGVATIDAHVATGESRPDVKRPGDAVCSGALNLDGELWIAVTAAAGEDLVSRMLQLVRDARRHKGPHQRAADRVAAWFTPAVCAAAVASAAYHGRAYGVDAGILVGLSVVLIACPCALGLATPMAVWTALGRAADSQVLFRSGAVLERLAAIDAACFDKTGTLTTGAPDVRQLLVRDGQTDYAVRNVAARLGRGSTHTLSQAIVRYVEASGHAPPRREARVPPIAEVRTHAGRGLAGCDADGQAVAHLGSLPWMAELGMHIPEQLVAALAPCNAQEAPLVAVAWEGAVQGVFAFREQLRTDARAALAACRALGLDVRMLTGDRRLHAGAVAADLDVHVVADQLPDEKVAALRRAGRRVAMIGDGLNDAPALAAAEVGVALGCGADLSRDAAGVCLLRDELSQFPWAVALARRTLRIVRQNLFWAFAYNGAGVVLAVAGRLNPIWAAAAMSVSSVLVVFNSLRLARFPESVPLAEAAASTADEERRQRDHAATAPRRAAAAPQLAGAAP